MNPKERTKAIKLITTLAALYERGLTETVVELYLKALADLSISELTEACEKAAASCKFFPKPIELRELVQDSVTERAEHAWVLLVEACRRSGDQSVFIADVCLAQAMLDTFGSWIAAYESIGDFSPEMLASKRKEFAANYRRAEKHSPDTDVRYQAGRMEVNNLTSLPNWSRRWIEQGRTAFSNPVLTVRDRIGQSEVMFDTATGQLAGASLAALIAGTETPRQLKPPPMTLPEPSAEALAMKPEEVQAGIRAMTQRAKK